MSKGSYIEPNDDAFAAQLITFKNNIGAYFMTLGLSPTQVAAQAADADYYDWTLRCQKIMQNAGQQWTAWKDLIRKGGPLPDTGAPSLPSLPTPAPTVVDPGVEARFRALAQLIKKNPAYNKAMGEALGIEAPESAAPDLSTVQPQFKLTLSGGRVEVGWTWQGLSASLDACEIQVDRGGGPGYVFLTIDTTPGYVDSAPWPATPVKWTYRAIYRVGDAQVGLWSNPVSVTVPT